MRQPETLPARLDSPGPPAKPRRIGGKLNRAIEAMVGGEARTITDAAKIAGMSREALSRAMRRPDVAAEIGDRVKKLVNGVSLARAMAVLDRLLDAGSEHVAFKAAELVLAINGLRPPPQGITINNTNFMPGWVIDLSDPAGIVRPAGAGDTRPVVIDLQSTEINGGSDADQ